MSEPSDIGVVGLAASLVLVVVTLVLSRWRGLRLERDVVVATVRALVQLLAVGAVLGVVLADDAPLALAWAWVAVMIGVATWTVADRLPQIERSWRITLPALTTSTAAALLVVFGLGIFPLDATAIVPVGGMLIGNAMKDLIIASQRIVAELSDKRADVEARLALGQPWTQASRPHVRAALRTALTSQIESTKAVGLVALPGTMTGLILAGVDPVDAVLVQAAVMFLILGAVAINVVVVGELLTRRLFTPDHRLVRLPTM